MRTDRFGLAFTSKLGQEFSSVNVKIQHIFNILNVILLVILFNV